MAGDTVGQLREIRFTKETRESGMDKELNESGQVN